MDSLAYIENITEAYRQYLVRYRAFEKIRTCKLNLMRVMALKRPWLQTMLNIIICTCKLKYNNTKLQRAKKNEHSRQKVRNKI